MGVIWASRKRTRQPGSIALADRSNPLNRGLRGAWDIGTSLLDLSGNGAHIEHASVTNPPTIQASAGLGLARRFTENTAGTEGPRLAVPWEKFANITGSWTVVASINAAGQGEGTFGRIFDTGTGAVPSYGLNEGFFVSMNGPNQLLAGNTGGTNKVSGSDIVTNRWHLTVVTYNAVSGNISFFVDGKLSGTPASPGASPGALTGPGRPSIGNRSDGFLDRDWDGLLGPLFVYDRAWSAEEARSLGTSAPEIYKLLTQERRPIFYSIAAGGSIYSAAYDESATATDGYTNTVAFAAATSESATATDAFINTAIFAAAVSEQATATDENTNTAVFSATISESGTATEGSDGATAGATYAEISEQADASDSYGATMVAAASISEEATATDGVTGANTTSAAISEEATATDSLAGANTTSAEISEQATATDSTSNTLEAAASISESATASDEQTNTAVINAAVSESATATDFFFGSVPGAGAGDGVSGNHDIVKMGRMMGRS